MPVEHVVVFGMRRPIRGEFASAPAVAVFSCRIGPFRIDGAALHRLPDGQRIAHMPRCRRRDAAVRLIDPDVQGALTEAASRAYAMMLDGAAGDV